MSLRSDTGACLSGCAAIAAILIVLRYFFEGQRDLMSQWLVVAASAFVALWPVGMWLVRRYRRPS